MPAYYPKLNLRSASQEQFRQPRRFSIYKRRQSTTTNEHAVSSGNAVVLDLENVNPQQEQMEVERQEQQKRKPRLTFRESSSSCNKNITSLSAAATAAVPPNVIADDFPVRPAAVAAGMAPPPPFPLSVEDNQQQQQQQQQMPYAGNKWGMVVGNMSQITDSISSSSGGNNDSQHFNQSRMTFDEFKEMKRLLNYQRVHQLQSVPKQQQTVKRHEAPAKDSREEQSSKRQ